MHERIFRQKDKKTCSVNSLLRTLRRQCEETGQVVSSSNPQYCLSRLIDRKVDRQNLEEEPLFSSALPHYLPEDKDLSGK